MRPAGTLSSDKKHRLERKNMNTSRHDNHRAAPVRGSVAERPRLLKAVVPLLALAGIALAVAWPRPGVMLPLAQAKSPAQRPPMPNFAFPTLDGKRWDLSQHRGRVVLLNFWATWCPPCRAETPGLVQIAQEYRARGLDVAGVAMDQGGTAGVRSFAASYQIPYPILMPTPGSPLTAPIQAFPTTILIDRRGRIAAAYEGELDEATFRPALEKLLRESPPTPGKMLAKGGHHVPPHHPAANQ